MRTAPRALGRWAVRPEGEGLPDRPRRRHRPDRQQRVRRREEDQSRKRHIAVDTGGLLLAVVVTTASLQDHDGAFRITAAPREAFSTITLVWADAGYTGRFVRDARKIWDLAVAILKRPDQAKGFVLLHRRWVEERSFAWLTKFRRLVRDYETLPATHEAMIWTAATWQLSNRLTR
jgi:transposase